ncbi:hypothetical protein ACFQYP_07430 [Nonomuraea antimicrobica]
MAGIEPVCGPGMAGIEPVCGPLLVNMLPGAGAPVEREPRSWRPDGGPDWGPPGCAPG